MDPIPQIPTIQTHGIYVRQINVPYVSPWYFTPSLAVPREVWVTLPLGVPVVDMPGCVEAHEENPRKDKLLPNLQEEDPNATIVLCPHGEYPSYNSMDYTPEDLKIIKEQAPPELIAPPEPPGTPETPETGDLGAEDPPCPGPTAPRLGTLGPNEKEKVSGFELQDNPAGGARICVVLYEPIGPVEQYLPSPQVAATTATIATVAGASALLAKPLADLLLRVFRPAIKQALTKANAILGRTTYRPTQAEIRANEYRKKKGLAGINFGKKKKPLKKK